MLRPSVTDYINALENPEGILRTLMGVAVERDIYGEPILRVGNSAVVFTYRAADEGRFDGEAKLRLLKCYVRPNPHLRTIYDYVERSPSPLLPRVRLLPDELYVHTLSGEAGWIDVVEGEWARGTTLDGAVATAARTKDRPRLLILADAFDDLCGRLRTEEWAHGDLKPENIVVGLDDRLVLIDCDAMWIPALDGAKAVEFGTPGWCDPRRATRRPEEALFDKGHHGGAHSGDVRFDKTIDDYPMALLSANLHAIAAEPGLCARRRLSDGPIVSI
ncbi:MAG: hypothetical protein LBV18_07290 [Alistipes sp.]|jgi:serine/threonine protein kinase|nr:hypothetical protein [Alistipes sp.]